MSDHSHDSRTHCTIADRLQMIRRRLLALEGTIRLVALPEHQFETGAGDDELAATMLQDLRFIDDELMWLESLPAGVRRLPAPTDEEKKAKEAAAVKS